MKYSEKVAEKASQVAKQTLQRVREKFRIFVKNIKNEKNTIIFVCTYRI